MSNEYEVDEIFEHWFDANGNLVYHTKWRWYPRAAATAVKAENLKKTAKDVLKKYHQSIGLLDIEDDDEIMKKLEATALKTPPNTRQRCDAKVILSHRIDENGELLFKTEFEGRTIIDRPRHAFAEQYEKHMVEEYIKAHKLNKATPRATPKQKIEKSKETPVRSGTRMRPAAMHAAITRRRQISPEPTLESSDGEEDVAGPSRLRSRSSSAALSESGGSRVSKPSVMANPMIGGGGLSSEKGTPRTSRGMESTGAKRAARVSHHVADKRQKMNGDDDYGQKKVCNIFKDEGGNAVMLAKDENGEFSVEELDAIFEKDPKFAYEALKEAFFSEKK